MIDPPDNDEQIEQVVAQLVTQNLALFAGLRGVVNYLMEIADSEEQRDLLEKHMSEQARESSKEFHAMAMQNQQDEDNNDE